MEITNQIFDSDHDRWNILNLRCFFVGFNHESCVEISH
jgi:hypothetical protein